MSRYINRSKEINCMKNNHEKTLCWLYRKEGDRQKVKLIKI